MTRYLIALAAALVLAGCQTGSGNFAADGNAGPAGSSFGQSQQTSYGNNSVVSTTSQIDPSTGQRVVTGGSFVIGSDANMVGMASTMIGSWTLKDKFARSCTLSFSTSPISGGSGAMQATRSGFCSNEFSSVGGWMTAGSGIALTNGSGAIQGQLVADGKGGYEGNFNTMFGPGAVTLTRGGF